MACLAGNLVCLCHEAAKAQAQALLQQLLAALATLAGYWPQAIRPLVAPLGALLLQHPAAAQLGAAEHKAVLSLLAQLQPQEFGAAAAAHGQPPSALPAMLLLPLLQQLAFSSSRDVKQWASHVLGGLHVLAPSTGSEAAGQPQLHGGAAAALAAQHLLQRLWEHRSEARHWLVSLHLSLAGTSSGSRDDGARPARDQQQVDSGTLLVLCALLQHPAEDVQRAALRSTVAALAATPLLGLSLLPLLVHQLQQQMERFLSGEQAHVCCAGWGVSAAARTHARLRPCSARRAGKVQQPSCLLLELLRALPAAGRHAAALPFVLRTLQPLLDTGECSTHAGNAGYCSEIGGAPNR